MRNIFNNVNFNQNTSNGNIFKTFIFLFSVITSLCSLAQHVSRLTTKNTVLYLAEIWKCFSKLTADNAGALKEVRMSAGDDFNFDWIDTSVKVLCNAIKDNFYKSEKMVHHLSFTFTKKIP